METAGRQKLLVLILITPVSSLTIPDTAIDPYSRKRLTYFHNVGDFYQADRVCRSKGGHLLLVDSADKVKRLQDMGEALNNSMHEVITRMVRHDDERLYTHDARCSAVNESHWSNWRSISDAAFNHRTQCVWAAEQGNFQWLARGCDLASNFVCEYDTETCGFQASSLSLAALTVTNATAELCQDTCLRMIGCFATAPSGVSTAPPHTLCLFLVVSDNTNPMYSLQCRDQYGTDSVTDPTTFGTAPDPATDPVDCVQPTGTLTSQEPRQTSLSDFLSMASDKGEHCTEPVSSITHTAYVTLTPEASIDYITVTATPSPFIQPTTVIVTETVMITDAQSVSVSTVTETHSCPETDVTITSSEPCPVSSVQVTQEVTVTQTQTASVTQSAVHTVTVTETLTMVPTATFSQTSPLPMTTSTPPSSEEFLEDLRTLTQDLTLDRTTLSRTRRKKESAADHRWSAQTIGSLAVILIAGFISVIVLPDLPTLYRQILKFKGGKKVERNRSESVLNHISAVRSGAIVSPISVRPIELEECE